MRACWLSLSAVLWAWASFASPAQAQIIIPDINKDTINRVPSPTGDRSITTTNQSTRTQPDPRCVQLSEALRRMTPGCR